MDYQIGATLNDIDNSSVGYDASFQPFRHYLSNRTAYVEWKLTFKKTGTSTDTTFKKLQQQES
ncbi:MAG: hypothetical protein IPL24_13605 [Bacteroidetes bacterium]|nr:hypothetical protein [Bacteroidota bacterium]